MPQVKKWNRNGCLWVWLVRGKEKCDFYYKKHQKCDYSKFHTVFHVDLKQKWALVSLTSQSPASISLAVRQLNVPRSQLKLRGPTFQPPRLQFRHMDRWGVNIQIWLQKYSNMLAIISLFLYRGHVHFFATFWWVSHLNWQWQERCKQKCRRIHCDLFWLMQMSCHGNEDQSVGDSSQFILMFH